MLEEVEYDVQADGRVIGQVWNRHGFWSAKAQGETHHNLESREEAIARVERARPPQAVARVEEGPEHVAVQVAQRPPPELPGRHTKQPGKRTL